MKKHGLALALRRILRIKRWTGMRLAKVLGVAKSTVSQWLSGKREPKTIDDLIKLADKLDVSLDELVGRDLERGHAMSKLRNLEKGKFRTLRELASFYTSLSRDDSASLLESAKELYNKTMKLERVDKREFEERLAVTQCSLRKDVSDAPAVVRYLSPDNQVRAEIRRDYRIITQQYKEPTYWFEEWLD